MTAGSPHPPEVWLRGPIEGVPALLQPVAHSLLQCREEVHATLPALTPEQLVARPGGVASAAYHVRHAAGSLDRLFTYARGEALSAEQMATFKSEKTEIEAADPVAALIELFDTAIDRALEQLRTTDAATLRDARGVGRAQLPSTVIGLLFHGAEHTQRHIGQLVTTAKIVRR